MKKELNWSVVTTQGRHYIQDDDTGDVIFEVYGTTRDRRETLAEMVTCIPQMINLITSLLELSGGCLPPETHPMYEVYESALTTLKKIR